MDSGLALPRALIRTALRLLAGALLALAAPALAHEDAGKPIEPACHAYADNALTARLQREAKVGWICADRDWHAEARHALLRYELGEDGRVPVQVTTRLARFEALRIRIEHPDGSISRHALSMHDFSPLGHMRQAAPLPEAGQPARRITLEFVAPAATSVVSEARLFEQAQPVLSEEQVWIAVLCGVLLVPLFFNLALFRALRDRFLLWHVGVVAFMLAHTVVTSGLTPLFVPMPTSTLAMMIALTFCGGAASAIMMASDFIEADKLDPRHRRALRFAAFWVMINGAFFVSTIDWLQGLGLSIYFANWSVVIAVLAWTLGTALWRGSRAVKFLIVSWLPLVAAGIWQIVDGVLGTQQEPTALFVAQRLAIGLEVLIGSVGVADRFIQLRRDRDDHRLRASEMARLAERDPLTGLLNRRAIEGRFAALREDGFATLALLDLDKFKAINDRFGHAVGDQVLQAVAASLPEDNDLLPLRMGGEEFMLLLRGAGAAQRAERLRQGLTARVARDVAGLDRPVTASMGLVEIPAEVMPNASFAAIYARADGLLYQAKSAGRNRAVSERMTVFAGHLRPRGRKAAA